MRGGLGGRIVEVYLPPSSLTVLPPYFFPLFPGSVDKCGATISGRISLALACPVLGTQPA